MAQRAHGTDESTGTFIPVFEGTWTYQSYLILPTASEHSALPGTAITAKKWAMGDLVLARGEGTEVTGQLTFQAGVGLSVHLRVTPGQAGKPVKFEGTGTGTAGLTKGAIYELRGWVFPTADGKIASIRGAVQAVRGPDAKPETELGGTPVGTVGAFTATA